jgi:hypothetical protein
MKIEITIEGSEPYHYPLKKAQTLIGSAKECDISLSAEGVSRKHLLVVVEGEQFFVIDQGSANGTFVNDERLVPGQRVEFTSFFPVKLAANVTLALLSDEEAQDKKFDFASTLPKSEAPAAPAAASATRTRMVNQTTFNPTSGAEKKVAAGKPRPGKAPKEAADPKARNGKLLAAVVLVGGVAIFYLTRTPPVDEAPAPVVGDAPTQVQAPPPIQEPIIVMAPESYRSAVNLITASKCQSANDLAWCGPLKLPAPGMSATGALVEEKGVSLVLPYEESDKLHVAFAEDFDWPADKPLLPAKLDPRDQVILHLLRLPAKAWADFTETRRWLFVTFSGQAGYQVLYVADGVALGSQLAGTDRSQHLGLMRTNPTRVLATFSGYLRIAD